MVGRKAYVKLEDLRKFIFVSDVRGDPSGKPRAVFVHTRIHPDPEKDTYIAHLWLLKGKEARGRGRPTVYLQPVPFTQGEVCDSSPRWSPDGSRIAFIRKNLEKKDEPAQVYVISSEGGEARKLTSLDKGVECAEWSPDGKWIAVCSRVRKPVPIAREIVRNEKSDVRIVERPFYKLNAEGFRHDTRRHIFLVRPEDGKSFQLTNGDWDVEGTPAWSPDGSRLAFLANLDPNADLVPFNYIYVLDARKGSRPQKILEGEFAVAYVAWHPNGKWLYFTGHTLEKRWAERVTLWRVPLDGGKPEMLMPEGIVSLEGGINSDARVASPYIPFIFAPDGSYVILKGGEKNTFRLYQMALASPFGDRDAKSENEKAREVAGGTLKAITDTSLSVESFSWFGPSGEILYSAMSATRLAEIFRWKNGSSIPMTRFNEPYFSRTLISEPRYIKIRARDGAVLEGWILMPTRKTRRPPVIFEIHGGPHTAYGNGFFHEFQWFAAQGFAVAYCNPRGSSLYGTDFAFEVVERYGETDYTDIMDFVDTVVKRFPVDGKRLYVTGGSYGGFMTNWIITHTDRFRAAVTRRSICNFVSMFGTSDIGYLFNEYEMGGQPWKNHEKLWEKSPLKYVENVTTPTMIIHAEEDYRCPMEQAEQLFIALKKLGKETILVRFPNENHELSRSGKPYHREENLRAILAWFRNHP
ncbi:MAG: S9 family peptidase [bacterium JZ-2024 1]